MKELRDYRLEDDREEMVLKGNCYRCHEFIYVGDEVFRFDDLVLCLDCVSELTFEVEQEHYF